MLQKNIKQVVQNKELFLDKLKGDSAKQNKGTLNALTNSISQIDAT